MVRPPVDCIHCGRLCAWNDAHTCPDCSQALVKQNEMQYVLGLLSDAYPEVANIPLREKIEAVLENNPVIIHLVYHAPRPAFASVPDLAIPPAYVRRRIDRLQRQRSERAHARGRYIRER
jgi:hypothetical protein